MIINDFVLNQIVTSGLVLNLDAGNIASYPTTGTTWTDLSGLGNNGTLVNGPTYSGANGGTLVFNGTNNYAATAAINLSTLSICAWAKFGSLSNTAYPTISNKETNNIARNWWLGTTPLITFGRSVSGADRGLSSTVTPTLNQWYYIVATNDLTPVFSIYINGALNKTATFSGTLSTAGSATWIGTYRDLIYPMNGSISNLSLYNRALTASEVAQNFNANRWRYGI